MNNMQPLIDPTIKWVRSSSFSGLAYIDMDDPVTRQKVMNNPAQYPPHLFKPVPLAAENIDASLPSNALLSADTVTSASAPATVPLLPVVAAPAEPIVVVSAEPVAIAPVVIPEESPTLIPETQVYVPSSPFEYYDGVLSGYQETQQRWLWQDRIPLGGVTLLDGDIGCGKSVFAQMLAAHISGGRPLPDQSQTIRGGVVIVAPYEEAGKAMYGRLLLNGADMSKVRIISFVPDTSSAASEKPGRAYRHFQLPGDLELLRAAMQDVDARLVILDPFIETLPDEERITQAKLHIMLRKLHQLMIEMDATCLLTRQCSAKGGVARPTILERSTHFLNIASSRLLLAQDPTKPGHLLLTQVACRMQGLAPTISFTITSQPNLPRNPVITYIGPDPLQAHDLLTVHPGTLHVKSLAPLLHTEIATSPEPVAVATLQTRFPHSTPSQVRRALRQLVQENVLMRVGRGLYTINKSTT